MYLAVWRGGFEFMHPGSGTKIQRPCRPQNPLAAVDSPRDLPP